MIPTISPSLPLAAYAEGWISGAKVVVFGNATSGLPERLIERGARQVQVYDPDSARAAEAAATARGRQVAFAGLESAGTSAREGSFDFGIIEDLATAGDRAGDWLSRLRRLLSRRGLGLVAAPNPEVTRRVIPHESAASAALGYYELYDALTKHFDEVRMLGQTPFVGYAIADFSAAEEPEVRIDTALVPGGAEEPEWFLAVVSALPATAEAFSVIQLPLADLELGLEARAAFAAETEAHRDPALDHAEEKVARLEAELSELRAELARGSGQKYESQLAALRAELAKREEWLAGLESRAATADQRADEAQTELDQRSVELADAKRQIQRLEARQEEEQQRKKAAADASQELAKAQKNAENEARRAKRLEDELRNVSQRVAEVTRELEAARSRPPPDAEVEAEMLALEAQLKERAGEITRLTEALHQTERFGRQLIGEVTELKEAAQADTASRELARLAQRNAELEADLEAARWTISSLETNPPEEPTLAGGARPASPPDGSEARTTGNPGAE